VPGRGPGPGGRRAQATVSESSESESYWQAAASAVDAAGGVLRLTGRTAWLGPGPEIARPGRPGSAGAGLRVGRDDAMIPGLLSTDSEPDSEPGSETSCTVWVTSTVQPGLRSESWVTACDSMLRVPQ
jgi:hypothetical protein